MDVNHGMSVICNDRDDNASVGAVDDAVEDARDDGGGDTKGDAEDDAANVAGGDTEDEGGEDAANEARNLSAIISDRPLHPRC